MSFVVDASAAVALHFADECAPFAAMEEALENGEEALSAPNFFQEVMETLRRTIREGRTTAPEVAAWLTVLDSYNITPVPLHPCAGSATWLIAEQLNISPYDTGYIAIAKARGLPLFSRDDVIIKRAPKIGVFVKTGQR
ncbi:MAG TPA: type II toxin-antitoxin system VapC family toxin [Verrucomicrobiae bacterium]|nr:type II toxin-antitoxin system VapC family toxin [Verrucomicrobiae bacterium]